jgi:hypothetical protein
MPSEAARATEAETEDPARRGFHAAILEIWGQFGAAAPGPT